MGIDMKRFGAEMGVAVGSSRWGSARLRCWRVCGRHFSSLTVGGHCLESRSERLFIGRGGEFLTLGLVVDDKRSFFPALGV